MSDDWIAKCLKAARTPRGKTPTAFDDPSSAPPEAQGIELGWTEDAIAVLLRTPGEPPKMIQLTPEAALEVSENLKKVAMLLLFKKSFRGSGRGSKDSGPGGEPPEPETV